MNGLAQALPSPVKVVVADDHWIARSAMTHLLPKVGTAIEIVEAASGDEVLQLLSEQTVDLFILDLNMPGPTPWDLIATLKAQRPQAPIVVMSVSEDRADVLRALSAGAAGYLPKTSSPEAIVGTIRRVLSGEVALPQRLLLSDEPSGGQSRALADDRTLAEVSTAVEALTPRQRQVFELLAKGLNNQDIADRLTLSVNTVRVHLQSIQSKLRLTSRSEMILQATRWKDRRVA